MADRWATRLEAKPGRTTMWIICGVIAFVLVISAALWALTVAASPIKGTGDAYAQKNGADNWVQAQTQFHNRDNTFRMYLGQIVDAKKAQVAWQTGPHPTDGIAAFTDGQTGQQLGQVVIGLTQQCQKTATDYNTASQGYLSRDFKDAGLPYQLDPAACSLVTASG